MSGRNVVELERLRQEYETSLSWRLTRPLRAAGRVARAARHRESRDVGAYPPAQEELDGWLEYFYGERLKAIEAACAQGLSDEQHSLFGDLDEDVWALLLTQEYRLYPHMRACLPSVPERELQEIWNGASGLALARQSKSFYAKLRGLYARHGDPPLAHAAVLDFGCGWGRLTRYLLRDVVPGRLYGCDPVEGILDVCRANRIAATFARSEFLPERLPFAERFDLAFAFSVFTHLSEPAHERSLRALHRSLRPGGILVVTIRPPQYLFTCDAMRPLLAELGPNPHAALAGPRYLFVPHPDDTRHPQRIGNAPIEYGETVITMAHVRQRWSPWFELLETSVQLDDLDQVILTLRRR